ncbi:hypothetical protein F53441_3420 [Fusarium austroafricanum]|uniref:Uncharacterized protein n=1 Tax=Fusarium austroafricanum TaxID=2364996 RepID=A0A8H4P2V4_9HYPO|nr:hypothetical protein F53441_3420 [Fusarium austroafricanum]
MAPLPTSVLETAITVPTSVSAVQLSVVLATPTAVLQNSTVAAGNTTSTVPQIFVPDLDGYFSLSILCFIGLCFFGIVLKDIYNKKRTGELDEEVESCGKVLYAIITLPCLVFSAYNVKWLWITFTNLFRKEENKIIMEKKNKDEEIVLNKRYDSVEVVARLGGGWPPKRPLATSKSDSPGDANTPYSDKDPEPGRLPRVAEVSVDPNHATHITTNLPLISGLPVVFEVPETVPAMVMDNAGFEPTPVHGSSSEAKKISSNPDIIIESGPSRHENALGIDNGEPSAQHDGGANSASHDQGPRSGFFSFIRGHHSGSASSGHSHGSHSYDYSHTGAGDHGGFDGCDGGDGGE